jgi:hypothetical protein
MHRPQKCPDTPFKVSPYEVSRPYAEAHEDDALQINIGLGPIEASEDLSRDTRGPTSPAFVLPVANPRRRYRASDPIITILGDLHVRFLRLYGLDRQILDSVTLRQQNKIQCEGPLIVAFQGTTHPQDFPQDLLLRRFGLWRLVWVV